ncbi:hypothetical protein FRC14_007236 [Serendipita sp. 396]|nr:hypothetical protein FRC14_007236 [Serendipita sp. 396]KAG8772138.1 hypothetical protein FRC15_002948 [Serendipita sp. 397]KAG8778692.1 hypothetical protein FRC16_003754 [Serendipita sp. 398]KAG8810367.1 hypothetical protein FRC18_004094 [Serendipita sp. 400]KAG8811168.1 hypothetical protein FRC19_004064 [Serendipita sp. 401]KAG8843663.1 hypothetical protein FRC20_003900 [Serendipita sp. 405]KAG8854953.1 hypothetical protein FRB91_002893 [Serendipita sp. 411]KAG9056300.1 hypothetical prot
MDESVPYDEFQTSSSNLAIDDGPWLIWRSYVDDINCGTTSPSWCQGGCLSAWVFPSSTQSSYTVSFYTTIALELAPYRDHAQLDYEWGYLPWWGSSKSTVGMELTIVSSVGNSIDREILHAGNWDKLFSSGQGWDYAPFKYTGKTDFAANTGEAIGYIPLYINITFPRQSEEYINYYVKGTTFKITTTPVPVTSNSNSATPAASSAGSTPASNGGNSSTPSISPPSESGSGSNRVSTSSLVGGLFGAAILAALIIIAFLLYMKKRKANGANASGQRIGGVPASSGTVQPLMGNNPNNPGYGQTGRHPTVSQWNA